MKTFIAIKDDETRATFLNEENLALLRSMGEVCEICGELTAENVCRQIGDAGVYMTLWGSPRLDAAILKSAPALRLLVHLGGTVAPFVSEEMHERGIRVISGNRYFAESTAEGALAYILAAQRRIPFYSVEMKNRRWKEENAPNQSLIGKTVGVVSYGAVAKNLVRLLQPFRVKLLVYDIVPVPPEDRERYAITQVSLEELFSASDIVSVHTPLNAGTHSLIGRELLERMKPGALFVNTSRGAVVHQRELEGVLREGHIRAALDVYETEPPEQSCALYDLPNVMMMPHMGGPTVDLRSRIARALIEESFAFLEKGAALKNEIAVENAVKMSES